MSSENLIKDQGIFIRVIILLILITYLFTDVWILLGENSNHVHPCHRIRSNRREKTVSVPEYSHK